MLLAAAVLLMVACGDDKESGPPSYVGSTDSALVTVAAGGKLQVGAVAVEIPQGAIDSDKEISVKVNTKKGKPKEKDIAIDVYEFGPDTQFAVPVKITFDLKGVSLNNKKADVVYLSQEDTDKWIPLTDSKVQNGKITATTTHFSEYTVLLTEVEGGGGAVGGQCETGFQACGGDIVGTWSYTSACAIGFDTPDGGIPYPCKDPGGYETRTEISGTITFNSDGTYVVNRTLNLVYNNVLPLSCLEEISEASGQPFTCEMTGGMIEGDDCVVSSADETPIPEESDGVYAVNGNQVAFTDVELTDGGFSGDAGLASGPNQISDFCVSGDSLRLRYTQTTMPQGILTESNATRVAQ